MKLVKKTAEYAIFQRNDKRHAIRGKNHQWINGEEKVKILQDEGLLKKPEPKPAEPEESAEAEAPAEEAASEASSEGEAESE